MELRGWEYVDVILFSGDAYVDHPSFGAAVIGRVLEAEGLRVAIVPQPDWRGDSRDFKKLGIPRLFFGVAPGAMDSMVNHYTANKRLRSDDAYTPDKLTDKRPDSPSIVYTKILKEIYPDTPVVLGGIEASMRRLAHYDYWQDRLRPGILADCTADLLIYGMGEKPVKELVTALRQGIPFQQIKDIPQTGYITDNVSISTNDLTLFPFEECLKDKIKHAGNFRVIEEESIRYDSTARILQKTGKRTIVINPPYPPLATHELDAIYDLPYTRMPHPKYKSKIIPAYEMIKYSVNIHRGCFGGCAFCTISAHQGKFVSSRSQQSILNEINSIINIPDFTGNISDLGGPSANMYQIKGLDEKKCMTCKRPSCLSPFICTNLNINYLPLLKLYEAAANMPGIKKVFIGSGIRHDMLMHECKDKTLNNMVRKYAEELITKHTSGRLKIAPEHTEDEVLKLMRKPSFKLFEQFKTLFDRINKKNHLNQQLIPYFISSHPGCSPTDMAELAIKTKNMQLQLEQVQDFTPTPMTLSSEMYHSGIHPYTLQKVSCSRTKEEKCFQRSFFFWRQPENRDQIIRYLRKINRNDIVKALLS
ncbi:MAG: YgiQ family radical SAM protein [Tannerella sp.]|nr:YgiQ family radical SAM protein [Tannerella sp.]